MAGHSKWANIKFRKAVQDAKRGKLFTKLIREITISVKQSGSDPSHNPRLRTAIDKALSNNVKKDAIDRAIQRGSGSDAQDLLEIRYEGYGPMGVAIIVDCMTNNKNRTVSEIRHVFSKYGGNLATTGSVGYLFEELGQINLSQAADVEKVMELALQHDAQDVTEQADGSVMVTTNSTQFIAVKNALVAAGFEPIYAEVSLVAANNVALNPSDAEQVIKLLDGLEELDDTQNVYSNAEFTEIN